MRRCAVCVLPSFYEGLPLVLVEALACGCRLVATRLPGIDEQLAPSLGDFLDLVPLPRLVGVDQPRREELPAFVECLEATLSTALDKPPPGEQAEDLRRALVPFTWSAVWERVAAVWSELCEPQQDHIVR
jgi:glycosyltransferase involved in cell wall biosynthesis